MTPPESSSARDIARQLLAQSVAESDQPKDVAAAMQRVCTRASANLRRSVGDDGYNALLARSLRRTEGEHPILADIRRTSETGIHLDGVVASTETHGLPAVTAALEALLAALVDILSGLIGADMVLNLLDIDGPSSQAPGARPTR
jgi:hypothetical protein